MTKIAFLGLGAMGRRMARRLIDAGHPVTVWNRSEGPGDELGAQGARVALSPEDAANGAEIVLTMLTDDQASQDIWSSVAPQLSGSALAVEMSTVSPGRIKALRAKLPHVLDAPVAGSLPQAEAGELIFLVGGEPADIERFRPLAEVMGKSVVVAGTSGKGAALKLAVNTALGVQTAMMADLQAFGRAHGIAPRDLMELLSQTPVLSGTSTVMGGLMATDTHPRLFPIDLLIKDLDYTLNGAADLPVTRAVKEVFAASRADGKGDKNISAVAR